MPGREIQHVWRHENVSPAELDTMEKDEQWEDANCKDTRNTEGFAEVRKVFQGLYADPGNGITGQPSNNMKNKLARLMRKIYAIDIDTRQSILPDVFEQDGAQRGGRGGDTKAIFFVERKLTTKKKKNKKRKLASTTTTGTPNSTVPNKKKKSGKKTEKKERQSSSDASSSEEEEEAVSKPSFSQNLQRLQDFEEEEESGDDEESVRDLQDQVAQLMEVATNLNKKLKIIRRMSKKIIQVIDADLSGE
jgi:hypothetical protein